MFEGSVKCLEQEQQVAGDCKVNVGAVEGDILLAGSCSRWQGIAR